MSIGFFIVGAIIFALYICLMFWNIVYSNKKQREENYPTIAKKQESKIEDRIENISLKVRSIIS